MQALTALHVYANVRAMRCLHMTSINAARLGLLLRHYLVTVCCAALRCAALRCAALCMPRLHLPGKAVRGCIGRCARLPPVHVRNRCCLLPTPARLLDRARR